LAALMRPAVVAREADASDLVRHRVAHDPEVGAAAARVLPDLVMLAGRIHPVVDIGVPCRLVGRSGVGASAAAFFPINEFGGVARAAIGACDDHCRSAECRLGVAPWPLSSIRMPRWNRSNVKAALSRCGSSLAMVQAKHQPDAGVALKPP